MDNNFLIQIEGTMEQEGDTDTVRLMTRGSFVKRNNSYVICYEETEATGYKGNITTLQVEAAEKVSMLRSGSAPSQLVIERGRRHVCHYDSGYGVLSLGVAADEIENKLTADGGKLVFSYTLDSGDVQISHNQVRVTVRPT